MLHISVLALVATPFNFVGLFIAMIIIIAIAFYVYAMVQRVVALPDRQARARLTQEGPVAKKDIEEASMSLDEKALQEKPVHTEDAHDDGK